MQPTNPSDVDLFTQAMEQFDPIFKLIQFEESNYILSMRSQFPYTNPISSEIVHFTNHPSSSNASVIEISNQKQTSAAPSSLLSLKNTLTLDTLTNLQLQYQKSRVLMKKEPQLVMALLKENLQEYYEICLTYKELAAYRYQVAMNNSIDWKVYLETLFHAWIHSVVSTNKSTEHHHSYPSTIFMDLSWEDSTKDVCKISIITPWLTSATTNSSISSLHIKLKFNFKLYAVREAEELSTKLSRFVWDATTFGNIQYWKRIKEEKVKIERLETELAQAKEQIQRLQTIHGKTNVDEDLDLDNLGEGGLDSTKGTTNNAKNKKPNYQQHKSGIQKKRRQPIGFLHPSRKDQVRTKPVQWKEDEEET